LAASLAATQRRVLLVDLDPQGNATMGSGIDKAQLTRGACEVLLGEADLASALVQVSEGGFTLLPANQDLTAAEVRLLTLPIGREIRLRQALQPKREAFDVILIDCPPALNMLTVNALVAADSVLIPMQCEYYSLEGLSALLDTVDQIREAANPELSIEGVLRTMFDPRNNLANEVSAQLVTHSGEKVFRTIIPRNIPLAEAPSFRRPAPLHDQESRGSPAPRRTSPQLPRPQASCSRSSRSMCCSAAATSRAWTCGTRRSPSSPTPSSRRAWCSPSWCASSAPQTGASRDATRSSPASGAGAPLRWPDSRRSRRSSATSRMRRRSPSPSSRTSSARTSIRSRRRAHSPASSPSSG